MKDPNWKKCLICGDSRDVIKRIPNNSIDFILTDPPYNIGKHSTGNIPLPGRSAMNNDVAPWDRVDFHPEEWVDEFIRILKPTGNLFIFTTYNQIGKWYDCLDHRFDASNFMVWHKTNPAPKIFQAGFLNSCEMVFTCWNKKHTWNFISQKEMHNFIESPICMKPERLSDPKHPAQKPVSILKKMIQMASNPNDIIFDPFMGVGSTGVAALEMGRKFIGVELEKNYYQAARIRIDNMNTQEKSSAGVLREPAIAYGIERTLFDIDDIFGEENPIPQTISTLPEDSLQPIIKWAGGKEKELKYIIPNAPEYNNYYEPFVGGGSVYAALRAEHYYINDLSSELISLYQNIADQNMVFFQFADAVDKSWQNAHSFFLFNGGEIREQYLAYRENQISKEDIKSYVSEFCKRNQKGIDAIIEPILTYDQSTLLSEMKKNLCRKLTRMKDLEMQKHLLPEEDLNDNIETAIKSALYMTFRAEYNRRAEECINDEYYCALFLFIRNYCYSGMFRYNGNGEFNVPYGGIAYNGKSMLKKLNFYRSKPLSKKFINTTIYNLDFEEFLDKANPTEDDFVFLDPPYDSEFSTYAQNEFTREDQERLANYMIHKCKAKWMMIIKNTDFIYGLYNQPGISIKTFDKEYLVSFMNRNDKKVTHLMITNY